MSWDCSILVSNADFSAYTILKYIPAGGKIQREVSVRDVSTEKISVHLLFSLYVHICTF